MKKPSGLTSHLLNDVGELQAIFFFVAQLPGGSTVTDLDEILQFPSVRARTRLWEQDGRLAAFALVDDYHNLWFDLDSLYTSAELENEIPAWGVACARQLNSETGEAGTLDACCDASNPVRISFLEKYGFQREELRTPRYARSLDRPVPETLLPPGYTIRSVLGEGEAPALVELHRAAFGTDQMTVEYRLAIMRSPSYIPELDLVVVAPDGELCAFCICGFEDADEETGYTDPIGTHVRLQRLGLGKAVVSAGLRALKEHGAKTALLGTSSENLPMQRLAESLGFQVVSEKLWFSRVID